MGNGCTSSTDNVSKQRILFLKILPFLKCIENNGEYGEEEVPNVGELHIYMAWPRLMTLIAAECNNQAAFGVV